MALVVAGCGTDDDPRTIDADVGSSGEELAREVAQGAAKETGDTVEVECPERIDFTESKHVDCAARIGGKQRKIRVSRMEGGTLEWRLYDFLDPQKVEAEIESGFREQGKVVTAKCQRVPIKEDHVSRCTASTAQRDYRIEVRQTDDIGSIRWQVVED